LEDNAAAHKQYQESLHLEKKAKILKDKVKTQKNTKSLSLPRRKPKFWRIMLQHTNNTENLSLFRRKPKFWRIKFRCKKIPEVPPSWEERQNFGR
jgi:hypothetical protein